MTEIKKNNASPKPRRWLRRLAWIGGVAVVLVMALYFVVTSGAFVKGVVLPKVGRTLNAELSAGSVAFHPFSSIELKNLKLTPKGAETLLTADIVRVRYSLMAIIGGKIAVEELTVASPVITVIENADGTSNLDPLIQSAKAEKSPAPRPDKPSEPANVDIKAVTLSNATIRQVKNLKGGGQDVIEISNVNLSLKDLKNGQSGKLDLSAAVSLANAARTNVPASSLDAKLTSAFTFDLSKDLKPATVKGDATLTVERASGDLTELNGLAANVVCEVSPTEIKQVALRFSKGGAPLGEVRASGPFDSAKTEGTLTVEILALERRVLNLAGAASGLDFGTTTINSTNTIQFAAGGNTISAAGHLGVARFQVIKEKQTSPTLDLKCDYSVSVDHAAQTALLKTLNFDGTQNGRPLLQGQLTSPMTVAFGAANSAVGDSTFKLTLTNLNLADWKAFAAGLASEGSVNASFALRSLSNGTELAVDFDSQIAGLSAVLGTDTVKGDAHVRATVTRRADQSLAGQFTLADLTGSFGDYRFEKFGAVADFDVAMKEDSIELRKLAGQLSEGRNNGGSFELGGNLNSKSGDGKFNLKLADLNQFALRPFLESALGGRKLVSVWVNSTASVALKKDDTRVNADFHLANLVVTDPETAAPTKPLELRFQTDVEVGKQIAQLNQCRLTLTPTSRAKNELDVTGKMDLSRSNAISGNIKVAAESLDLTSYYDLFGEEQKSTNSVAAAPTVASAPPSDPTREPDPVVLPLSNFVAEVSIGRLYLREVDAQKLQATARVDGGHIVLKPLELTLNGAPVNATVDLDISVPGYKYDVTFSAKSVPLTPFVNSFQPERKGQIEGTLTASAQIKGAGVTGANLQKNLTGKFDIVSTNLNLSLKDVRSPLITPIINIVIGLPDLLRNPVATLGGWLTGAKGGWADKMTASPIDVVLVNGSAGGGHIQLRQAEVRSAAFKALVTGDVAIAPILTNSAIKFPVTISLSRALAEEVGQLPANTPTNAVYVALPDFVKETGTLGKPKTEIDKLVIAQIAARAGTGIFKGIAGAGAETGGSLLNKVEGALGLKPATNGAPGSATNQPPPNLLDLFKKPKTK